MRALCPNTRLPVRPAAARRAAPAGWALLALGCAIAALSGCGQEKAGLPLAAIRR